MTAAAIPAPTTPREGWTRLYWEAASILAGRHPRPPGRETALRFLHQLAEAPTAPAGLARAARRALLRHYRADPALASAVAPGTAAGALQALTHE